MQELINEAIVEMVNNGTIGIGRVKSLIYIKSFVDRISTKKYINDEVVSDLKEKFGVNPNVITWGDYFQTELASSLLVLSDEEFDKVLDTVKFDMIASYIIFSEKDTDFFEWVEKTYLGIIDQKDSDYTEEEAELVHLKILMDYYRNLGIKDNFTGDEMKWYLSFKEAKVV